MNLIKEVKERTDIIKVAEIYGLKLNRAHKCVCPFHKEKTPSLSISQQKQIWKCFGCGKGGDVISLVSELLNINAYEAAKDINNALNLRLDPNQKESSLHINQYKNKQKVEQAFKDWILKTYILLTDYLHLIWNWEKEFKPKVVNEELNELYVEALQNRDYIEYIIDDIFINGTNEDKIWFWKNEKKVVRQIEQRVRTFRRANE